VVGAGVSGIVTSWILGREHQVDLFEAGSRIGGHTNTVTVKSGADAGADIDTGFIVLNDQNYPLLHKFLKQLEVEVRWSDMSFGYHCQKTGMEYAGRNLASLFCKRSNLLNLGFYRFLGEIRRFCVLAGNALSQEELAGITLGEFVQRENFSEDFLQHYLLPMAAAIWSSPDTDILEFPAERFVEFFKNHGLLGLSNRPRWQTVKGGSHSYLKAFSERFEGNIYCSSPVKSLRTGEKLTLETSDGKSELYDRVVLACHADQALSILEGQPAQLSELLSNWSYHKNKVFLHSDASVMPTNRRAWCSWNYYRTSNCAEKNSSPVFVSYYMNHLQGLKLSRDYFVTLNPKVEINPDLVVAEVDYEHPCFNLQVSGTSAGLEKYNGEEGVFLAGAYTGNGFHEDGVRSAVSVCQKLGMEF